MTLDVQKEMLSKSNNLDNEVLAALDKYNRLFLAIHKGAWFDDLAKLCEQIGEPVSSFAPKYRDLGKEWLEKLPET